MFGARHSLNHASEPIFRGTQQLTGMFYCSGWLASGSNFLHLLQHLERWIWAEGTVVVSYDRRGFAPLFQSVD